MAETRPKQSIYRIGRPPKHSARLLQQLMKENSLDQRTGVAKLLKQVRDDLAEDAGGWEHLSNRERLLVDRTASISVILSSIEGYVFKQKTLLDNDGALLPVLGEKYLSFTNTLRLNLISLGLRPDKPTSEPDLSDYIKQKAKK